MGVLIASCTANSNLEYKTPKRCVSPLRQRLAVVKWYRIDADWYKPDPTRLADRRTKPYLKPRSQNIHLARNGVNPA